MTDIDMENLLKKSEILKTLGHPIRLKIVFGLVENTDCNVNKMVEHLGLPQSTVSQHLALLRNKGIIVPRKQGVQTCYEVVDNMVLDILNILRSHTI
jgi:DNA-binding transcriptional ArsR family regulator